MFVCGEQPGLNRGQWIHGHRPCDPAPPGSAFFDGAPITWNVTPAGYEKIRHDWLAHVSAEEELFRPYSEEEFLAETTKMLDVFIDDCVMELVFTGERWHGREEALSFYRTFTNSFADMEWTPQAVVVGPQESSTWSR